MLALLLVKPVSADSTWLTLFWWWKNWEVRVMAWCIWQKHFCLFHHCLLCWENWRITWCSFVLLLLMDLLMFLVFELYLESDTVGAWERERETKRENRKRIRMRFKSWFGFWPFLGKGGPPELKLILYFRASKFPSRNSRGNLLASCQWLFRLRWSFVNPSLQQEGSGAYNLQSLPSRGSHPPAGSFTQTSRCSNGTNSFHFLSSGACLTEVHIADFASHRQQIIFHISLRITHIFLNTVPSSSTLSLDLKVADRGCQVY